MAEAGIAMAAAGTPSGRLEGPIPRPQNFHKRIVILQTILSKLYGNCACDKGTLCQLKNFFGNRNVKKKASECVNHVSDFLDFVTEAHVLLLATRLAGNTDLQELLYPSDEVLQMAKGVVQFIWPQMEVEDAVQGLDDYVYTCICNDFEGDKSYDFFIIVKPKRVYERLRE